MKDGFIKCAAITPEITVGDTLANAKKTVDSVKSAVKAGVKLAVFPELCITGYTVGDLLLQDRLLASTDEAVAYVLQHTKNDDIVFAIGAPLVKFGKLFNCAIVAYKGEILGVVPKINIPNYGEFYEARHFTSGEGIVNSEITVAGRNCPFGQAVFVNTYDKDYSFGVEICEDMWVANPPACDLVSKGARIILNLSASDEVVGKSAYRRLLVQSLSGRLNCGYVYADAGEGESTTDVVFAGHNLIAESGSILAESKPFADGVAISEIDVKKCAYEVRRNNTAYSCQQDAVIYFDQKPEECKLTRKVSDMPFVPYGEEERKERCELILTMQAKGLLKRIKHTGSKKLVVGLSGGLDSALALLVMVKAADMAGLDRKSVLAVTLPCFGTTKRTKSNAQILAEGLGVDFKEVNIAKSVTQHFEDIGQQKDKYDVTFENAQARERTQVLMDIANRSGGLVIGTGDLSELALGWATYNGDHMSMYGVNASIPKTLVRYLVKYYADTASEEKVSKALYDILDTPVSPELLPTKDGEISQCTENIVGPYELHDFFIYYAVRWGFEPLKIYRLAKYAFAGRYEDGTILKWLKSFYKRFFSQQFKRSCVPDGPKVGSVTLSPRGDWRMPSDASSRVWLEQLDKLGGEE